MSGQGVNVRLLALETLLEAERGSRQSHLLIRDVLDKYGWLPERDRAFFMRLCEGTLEYRLQMDYVIDRFSSVSSKKLKPVIREILRMGIYQILYMDAVPDAAAVNESVRLAGKKGFGALRGFVNGVLRAVSRGKDRIRWPEPAGSAGSLSVRYSVPAWLVSRWIGEYGPEQTEKICASFQERRPVTVRVRGEIPPGETGELLPAPWMEDARVLADPQKLATLEAFRNGALAVQDISSMAAVRASGIRPGDHVLDVCAAPGGKSMFAADLTGPEGSVTARDLSDAKCGLLEQNRQRCALDNLHIEKADAVLFRPEDEGRYDVVLADLPCSGYGVIGRKPDIRYRASEEKERSLVQLQRQILANAVRYVRPGGTLLYSTCTFHREENEDQVRRICGELSGEAGVNMHPDDLRPYLPEALAGEQTAENGYIQLLPGIHPCDGFFIARLIRENT